MQIQFQVTVKQKSSKSIQHHPDESLKYTHIKHNYTSLYPLLHHSHSHRRVYTDRHAATHTCHRLRSEGFASRIHWPSILSRELNASVYIAVGEFSLCLGLCSPDGIDMVLVSVRLRTSNERDYIEETVEKNCAGDNRQKKQEI